MLRKIKRLARKEEHSKKLSLTVSVSGSSLVDLKIIHPPSYLYLLLDVGRLHKSVKFYKHYLGLKIGLVITIYRLKVVQVYAAAHYSGDHSFHYYDLLEEVVSHYIFNLSPSGS